MSLANGDMLIYERDPGKYNTVLLDYVYFVLRFSRRRMEYKLTFNGGSRFQYHAGIKNVTKRGETLVRLWKCNQNI